MASVKTPSLVQLAEQVLEQARKLESQISAPPTFFSDTLADLPDELRPLQMSLIDASNTFNALVRGAGGTHGRVQLRGAYMYPDEMALRIINRFRVPQAVPLEGSISFPDLAAKLNVDEDQITRVIRHAMTFHQFYEPEKGYVAHTADTKLQVEDSTIFDLVGVSLDEHVPGAIKAADAMIKWPGSGEPNETGANLAWNTDMPFFKYLSQFPERIRRFSALMTQVTRAGARAARFIADSYPWEALNNGKGTMIDVGGGNGHISIAIAKVHKGMNFVVQDLPGVSKDGEANLPEDLQSRVSFASHDFFTSQPAHGADAYFFMHVFHNWSDKYAIKIIQALIPALKPGARVLVCDRTIPEPGTIAEVDYHEILAVDMMMLALLNAKERRSEDMAELFQRADSRLKFNGAYPIKGTHYTICEGVWTP